MSIKKSVFAIVFFTALFFIGQQSVFACSCMATPTVLDAFDSSKLVVVTKLVSVEKVREKEGEYDIEYIKSAKMVVEKVYKGNVKVGDELIFAQGGGADCVWTFDEEWVGDKFLFYVGASSKGHPAFGREEEGAKPMYYAITCGRSNGLSGADEDLSYLDNMDKLRGKTRVSGRLYSWYSYSPGFGNLRIKIIGKNKTFTTKTNERGFFEIYDLPAGDYIVEPERPKGWKVDVGMLEYMNSYDFDYREGSEKLKENQFPIRLEKGKHADLELLLVIDNAIRGRVLSPNGKPMKGVCISAVSTELKEGDYRGKWACTDENGKYVIDELSPDTYMLVVNADGKISSEEPFGILFYPGVSEYKQAGVVAVEAGKFVNDMNIQISKTALLTEISGKFLYSDGKPIVDDWVEFVPSDEIENTEGKARAKTDAEGRFTIKVIKGISGTLSADMYVYNSKYANCPEVLKIIAKTGNTNATVKTNEVEIQGNENMSSVNLVLPFPKCEKD